MEKGLIKVETVVEAAETVMLWLAKGLVIIHLPIAVKVGPPLFIGQNLCAREKGRQKWEEGIIKQRETLIQKVKHTVRGVSWSMYQILYMTWCNPFLPTSYDLEILMNMSSAFGSLFLSGCLQKSTWHHISLLGSYWVSRGFTVYHF